MSRRLHGAIWLYWLGGGRGVRPPDGQVELSRPTENFKEDEGFARYLVRLQLQCKGKKRLPSGTELYPEFWFRGRG